MHVSLYVSDVRRTVDFYTKFFRKPADKQKADYAKFELDEPGLVISFVENPERVSQNFGHLGFRVNSEQELSRYRDMAAAESMITEEEIGTNCCYARQDKFWVADPDGVQWEVYHFHEDVEFNDPKYAKETATACCASEVTDSACCESSASKMQKSLADLGKTTNCC